MLPFFEKASTIAPAHSQITSGEGFAAGVEQFYWDDPYPIALELMRRHPGVDPLTVSWETLHRWVVELPQFVDDETVTSLYLLEDIQKEWYEEVISR